MANALFAATRASFLKADCDLDGTVKLSFIDHADDTPVAATDDFYDDITGAAIVGTSGAFTTKTFTDGVFDADDVTTSAVSGDPFESIVIWLDTAGASSTDPLVAFLDTATGLPTTPNGGDITVAWDSGANKIFKL